MLTASIPWRRGRINVRAVFLAVLLLAVLAAGGYFASNWFRPKTPAPDMTAVMEANSRGVGHMEQFKYDKAIEAFEEVRRLAPDWTPGRINLGIALLNEAGKINPSTPQQERRKKQLFQQAVTLFRAVLNDDATERKWHTYAHYCLGVIYSYLGRYDEAKAQLEKVLELDPHDAETWYQLGMAVSDADPRRAADCFEKAMKLDPNIGGAMYNWAQNRYVREHFPEKVWKARLDLFEKMRTGNLFNGVKDRYSELGRYCEVIGRVPRVGEERLGPPPRFAPPEKVAVRLGPNTRWATAADLGTGVEGELRTLLRRRFGGVIVVLDYDGDRKPDLLLLAAVVRQGKLGNLLLHNEGEGRFADVTARAKLADTPAGLACTVGDFDNDGRPDLFITHVGGVRLYRNRPGGTFEDVTGRKKVALAELKTICLGAAFVDLDQDGDLDLVISQYAASAAEAVRVLKGGKSSLPGCLLYLNTGEARPAAPTLDPPPLEPSFTASSHPAFKPPAAGVSLAVSDVDLDRDLDLLLLADNASADVILNDRLLRFRRAALPKSLAGAASWNGALVLDVNGDERSDLLLLRHKRKPLLLLHRPTDPGAGVADCFAEGTINSPPLKHAHAVDMDLDGKMDVVGLSSTGQPVLLLSDGKRLVRLAEGLGADRSWPKDLIALATVDLNGDVRPDVLGWSEGDGLWRALQRDNGNHGLALLLSGHRQVAANGGEVVRCNAEGFGTRLAALAADHHTSLEYVTLSAGLGQSLQPALLGLGRQTQAQVVSLRWPDTCWQAEFNFAAGQVHVLKETNRKETSCPILFAWDGRRFGFVTDFLGGGSLGESLAGGGHRPPRPQESVKIEAHQLQPRNGQFLLKIAEPMSEITYLDRLQMIVLDHPEKLAVYPDERMVLAGIPPTEDLLSFERRIAPVKAINHRGCDVTRKLLARDRDTVDDFARRTWVGFAEEHWVELDFGDRLKEFGPKERLILCLAGWTDYAYPESIWAAAQAGVAVLPPTLERRGADGKWQPLGEVGFPAGLPRLMTYEITGQVGAGRCLLRLRTNLQVYWDQVFVAPLVERVAPQVLKAGSHSFKGFRATPLEVSRASLVARGCMQEFSPDGRLPTLYDYDRLAPLPVNRLAGRMTRFGDVTELLRQHDDRFVIFGTGDEIEVRFDASTLPPLPKGWKRSYVLRTWGYCKDTGPFTATGDSVEPLPFRAMSNYPPGPGEKYPDTPLHRAYLKRYNTRQVGPRK